MLRLVLGVLWICVVGSAWAQDGADAVAPTPVVGTFVGDQYMQTRGGTGGAGGDGGDVLGSVQIDVNLALGSNQAFVYTSSAGWGGAGSGSSPGGDGGDSEPSIVANITGYAGSVTISSNGGDGGGSDTGPRGNGGNSGPVSVTADGNFGSITVVTNGGSLHGQSASGGLGGDAGDATLDFSGAAGSIYVQSAGGYGMGAPGQGGSVKITVAGEVAKGVLAHNAGGLPGTVLVVLDDGAKVGGVITNYNNTHGELNFAMHVSSQAELDAATASIAAVGGNTSGTVLVAGNSFAFSGFSTLRNLVSVLQAQNPGNGPIVVTVSGGPTITVSAGTEPGTAFRPTRGRLNADIRSRCRGRATLVSLDDGRVQLNVAPRDVQPFILGWFSGADFRLAAPGWAVEQSAASRGLRVKVSDPKGKLLATCFLRAT